MAPLNTKSRKNFEEWLKNIDDNDLKLFVFANTTDKVEFQSDDFKLVHAGVSDGEPVGCHIIEARVNGNTKNKHLKELFKTTKSLTKNKACLALALFPTSMDGYCMGDHVRQALQESPVKGQTVVNKVHVQWSPSVKWDGGTPKYKVGFPRFMYEKIPFQGYKVDGTVATKKNHEKK